MAVISGMFRTAFDRIRPSIASAAELSSSGFNRLLSLTGSFNSRTGLLAGDGEEVPPVSQAHETTTTAVTSSSSGGAFDVEALATTRDQAVRDDDGAGDEAKRVSKSVQPVCLSVATASLAMSFNLPAKASGALYVANLSFICLGLFASLGLSMYTVVSTPGDAAVASVQKRGMLLAMASVLAAFTLRIWPGSSSSSSPAPPRST
ncbi:uncharacterized protein LOC102721681 [Oryza brachyantha]|uniref:uncharacterized protein LOC102721681 n=1 Tax=Oryza brachyantha TaxID=4533 RepID=UPI0003EAC175|nr:uncharacterized protein LOC102721681 [Oryza brachyantha]